MSATFDAMVGMSGGVDSSVAALRLRDAGHRIAGLFMQNWDDDGSGECRAEDDRRDAVAPGGLRRGEADRLAVKEQLSPVGDNYSGDDFAQGAFAAPVRA